MIDKAEVEAYDKIKSAVHQRMTWFESRSKVARQMQQAVSGVAGAKKKKAAVAADK